jgi:hypothetical protein
MPLFKGTESVKFRTGQEDNHEWLLGKNLNEVTITNGRSLDLTKASGK